MQFSCVFLFWTLKGSTNLTSMYQNGYTYLQNSNNLRFYTLIPICQKIEFQDHFFFFIINKQKNSTFFYVLRGRNEPTIVTFIVDTLDWQVLQVAPEQFSREKRHNDAFAGSCHWVHSGLFYLQIYTAVYILIFCMSFITSLLGTSETKNCSVVNINKEMKYFLSYRSRYLPSIKLNLF